MTETSLNSHRSRCRGRLLKGTPVAFVLGLLLAACQGAGPPDSQAPGKNAEQLLRVADDTRAGGDLGTAVDLYRRAIDQNGSDPRAYVALGSTLAQLHAYTEAAATYRAGLKSNSKNADLRRGLAIVLLSLNQPEGAIAELNDGIAATPEDARLYSTLGVAHDLMGRHDLAQQDYRNGIRLAPKNQGLRNNYGLSLALSGDYPAAAVTLSELADDANASPRHRLNLALVYGLAGDDRKASAIARTALDEAAVKSNLAYYVQLRAMDDRGRANAIMGGQLRGTTSDTVIVGEPTPPRPIEDERTNTAAADPAPRMPVTSKPLAESPQTAPAAPETMGAAEPAAGETPDDKGMAAPVKLAKAAPSSSEPPPPPAEESAASPAEASAPTPAEESAAAEPKSEPEPTATPSAPKSQSATVAAKQGAKAVGFAVQAGAFASEANARKLADQLNGKGYDVAVVHHKDREGRDWFVVRAGGYGSEEEAAAAARHMRDSERLPAIVVHLRGSSQA